MLTACSVTTGAAERKFSYATYFESNMVLQMAPARSSVWGFAESLDIGQTVVVNVTSSIYARSYVTTIVSGNHPHAICFVARRLSDIVFSTVLCENFNSWSKADSLAKTR